jgi:hypothetical protein
MNRSHTWRSVAAAVAILGAGGCSGELNVTNPNAPDAKRAFSDPATIAAVAGGSFRTFFVAKEEYNSGLLLATMAESYAAAWNNFNIRYYTSMCSMTGPYSGQCDCPERCAWANTLTSAQYVQLEYFYYGYYSALSSANDALKAIRCGGNCASPSEGVVINDPAYTKMIETASVMMQGMVFAEIAKNYDQGFVVQEHTDLSDPLNLPLLPRAEMRDSAIQFLDEAYELAKANSFTTPSSWTGINNGPTYSNTQLAQAIRTIEADLLVYYPRSFEENNQVPWQKVADYASQGLSQKDFGFWQDLNSFYSGTKNWSNDVTTMRASTQIAKLVSTNHNSPWPVPQGNPYPIASPDKRVGDGSWGPDEDFLGVGTHKQTGNGGTYIAFTGKAIQRPARGQYHQSNIGQIRYSYLAYPGYGLPNETGLGFVPVYTVDQNRLLWAEALINLGQNAQAAQKINVTRVGNGGLPALTGAETKAELLRAVQYENELELMGLGATPFYNRRRGTSETWNTGGLAGWTTPCPTSVLCLFANSPRQMPIPAKELGLLQKELYTFGGADNPQGFVAGANGSAGRVKNVRQIWADLEAKSRAEARSRTRR